MRYKLHTKDVEQSAQIDELVMKNVLPKLVDYMLPFKEFEPLLTLHVKKHTKWGYTASGDMMLPQDYKLHAESHADTIKQTLINLRKKLKQQIMDYRDKVIKH